MLEEPHSIEEPSWLTDARAVDHLCDQFETAWRGKRRPSLEAFLALVPSAVRGDAFRQLLSLEIEYQQAAGETPQREDYLARFHEFSAVIRDVFCRAFVPPGGGASAQLTLSDAVEAWSGQTMTLARPIPDIPGYKILGELGRGGMGVVYKAVQVRAARVVALKMILSDADPGPAQMARFQTEVEASARLHHPNIVQIFEVGEYLGRPFFSLEYCARGSLDRQLLAEPLPPGKAAALVERLALAISLAHDKGVVHRDLKPANVLIAEDGSPKVSDFGLAKILDDPSQTASGAVLGTPCYMAPEQANGRNQEVGVACDIYALGAILYRCLTSRPPFRAATTLETLRQVDGQAPVLPRLLNSQVPTTLETICLKCLEKNPQRRYSTARALAEDLRRFLDEEPIEPRPPGVCLPTTQTALPRSRRVVITGLLALLLLLLLGSFYGSRPPEGKQATSLDDRQAAEWVLSIGGRVRIFSIDSIQEIAVRKDLPGGDLKLIEIDLNGNPIEDLDAGLEQLGALANLTGLGLNDTLVTNRGLKQLQRQTNLSRLGLERTAIGNSGLASLQKLTKLTNLHLNDNRWVTGDGLFYLKDLTNLKELHLAGSQVDDQGMKHLKHLTGLQFLGIDRTRVTDSGLVDLKELSGLTNLDLRETAVTDAGLKQLQSMTQLRKLLLNNNGGIKGDGLKYLNTLPNLKELHLAGSQVDDRGLENINDLTGLCLLGLDRTRITDTGLGHLEKLTNLTYLDLPSRIGDAGLYHLRGLGNLQELRLGGSQVTDAGMEHLTNLTNLRRLYLEATQVGDAGLAHLKGLKQLQCLHVYGQVSDAGLRHLQGLTNLTGLLLVENKQVAGPGLEYLGTMTSLTHLHLDGTRIDDQSLQHLKGLTKLQRLSIHNTKVTERGFQGIKQALPDCYVTY